MSTKFLKIHPADNVLVALTDLKAGDKCTCVVYDKKDGTKSVGRIVVGEDKGKEAPKAK